MGGVSLWGAGVALWSGRRAMERASRYGASRHGTGLAARAQSASQGACQPPWPAVSFSAAGGPHDPGA
jgi:hypothetical protein